MTIPNPLVQYANKQPWRARKGTTFVLQTPQLLPSALADELDCSICVEPTIIMGPCYDSVQSELERVPDWPLIVYADLIARSGFFTINDSLVLDFNGTSWVAPLYTVLSTAPFRSGGVLFGTRGAITLTMFCGGCTPHPCDICIFASADATSMGGGSIAGANRQALAWVSRQGFVNGHSACTTPSGFAPCAPVFGAGELTIEYLPGYNHVVDRTSKQIDTKIEIRWRDPAGGQDGRASFHIHE
jgi:hypothetical protein